MRAVSRRGETRRESDKPVTLGRNERWTRTGCHETGSSPRGTRKRRWEPYALAVVMRAVACRRKIKHGTLTEKRSPLPCACPARLSGARNYRDSTVCSAHGSRCRVDITKIVIYLESGRFVLLSRPFALIKMSRFMSYISYLK